MIMHIGVIHYARENSKALDNKLSFNKILIKLYIQHEKILDNMLESIKDEKMKIKIKCFKEKQSLFNLQQYKYEHALRMIGIILYRFDYDLELDISVDETQNLENKTNVVETKFLETPLKELDENLKIEFVHDTLKESIKLKEHEKKNQTLKNESNVEKEFLETPPKESDGNLIKVKQEQIEFVHDTLKESIKLKEHEKKNQTLENESNVETEFLEAPPIMELSEGFKKVKRLASQELYGNGITNLLEQSVELEQKTILNTNKKSLETVIQMDDQRMEYVIQVGGCSYQSRKEFVSKSVKESNSVETKLSKEEKNNEKKKIKLKKKLALKQSTMVDTIEKILNKFKPLSNDKKSVFNNVVHQKSYEYQTIVTNFLCDLLDQDDYQLTTRIQLFLEKKDTWSTDSKYQYEFILMYLGAMTYNHDSQINLEKIMNSSIFSNLDEDGKGEMKNYTPTLQKLYTKYEIIVTDMLESVKDEKIKIKIKCFRDKKSLFALPQYTYEWFISTIGVIVYGCRDALEEL